MLVDSAVAQFLAMRCRSNRSMQDDSAPNELLKTQILAKWTRRLNALRAIEEQMERVIHALPRSTRR
jgi:hypothetical protein